VAKENAATYELTIDLIRGDILDKNFGIEKTFNLIISNPPYITAAEKEDMHERVLDFEPNEALFVTNDDPLQFYKAILSFSEKHLAPNGIIFLELNRDYGIHTQKLYEEAGFDTELRKDMYGNTRMLKAQKKPLDFQQ
jgi:release factor glutamine methyltransferase